VSPGDHFALWCSRRATPPCPQAGSHLRAWYENRTRLSRSGGRLGWRRGRAGESLPRPPPAGEPGRDKASFLFAAVVRFRSDGRGFRPIPKVLTSCRLATLAHPVGGLVEVGQDAAPAPQRPAGPGRLAAVLPDGAGGAAKESPPPPQVGELEFARQVKDLYSLCS
jgi:hypothetical protein